MLFINSYKIDFFFFCLIAFLIFIVFLIYNDVYSEDAQRCKNHSKRTQRFMLENYYTRIGFTKENTYYLMKHHEKIFLLHGTKLIKKYLMLVMLKNNINHF